MPELQPPISHRNKQLFVTHQIDNNGKLLRAQGVWILAVIVFWPSVIAIRIRLPWNSNSSADEGEYALLPGQLILQGIPPYKLAYKHEVSRKLMQAYRPLVMYGPIFGTNDYWNSTWGCSWSIAATIVLIFFLGPPTGEFNIRACSGNELCGALCKGPPPFLGFGFSTRQIFVDVMFTRFLAGRA